MPRLGHFAAEVIPHFGHFAAETFPHVGHFGAQILPGLGDFAKDLVEPGVQLLIHDSILPRHALAASWQYISTQMFIEESAETPRERNIAAPRLTPRCARG